MTRARRGNLLASLGGSLVPVSSAGRVGGVRFDVDGVPGPFSGGSSLRPASGSFGEDGVFLATFSSSGGKRTGLILGQPTAVAAPATARTARPTSGPFQWPCDRRERRRVGASAISA